MKRIMKMVLCLMAVFGITAALAPQTVLAYDYEIDGVQYTVMQDGNAKVSGYSGSGGAVMIADTVEGYNVTTIGEDAFRRTGLSSVTIPDSVTTIEDGAFYECKNLSSVTIGNGVTTIGLSAFNSTGLSSVTIPDSVTSIGNSAFEYCKGLTSVTIGNGVETIGKTAFGLCMNLQNVTIGNSVTTIGDEAFYMCAFTSVTIPDSVTTIENNAFRCCSYLGSVTIPDNVTTIGEKAFESCSNLQSAMIGNKVTTIGNGAFQSCPFLDNVTIPASVTTIGNEVFASCISLATINYGGSKTQWDALIANAAGWNDGCPSTMVINYGSHIVKITAGANMAPASGSEDFLVQIVKNNSNMTPVTFNAADGYIFPQDYRIDAVKNLTVNVIADGKQVTISGAPEEDEIFTLPDPLRVTAITVTAQDILSGSDETISVSMTPSSVTGTVKLTITDQGGKDTHYSIILTAEDHGNRTMTLPSPAVGQYTVTAEYLRGNGYTSAAATTTFTVTAAHTVTITPGGNMAHDKSSGALSQNVAEGTDMTPVTFTAADGFCFPADYTVPNLPAGFSVAKNENRTQITVSGKPTADAEITLPAAAAKTDLTITARDQTYVYNGKKQGPGDTAHENPAEIADLIDVKGLQPGDYVFSIIVDGQGETIGNSELVPQGAVIKNSNGAAVTGSYVISYVNGTLEIVHVVEASASDIIFGDTETIEVTIPKDAAGTVTLKIKYPDGSETQDTVAMTQGKGQLVLNDLPVGTYEVTAVYANDPTAPEYKRYADDSNTTTFKVTEKPVTTFTVSFDANGGSGEMPEVTGVSGDYALPQCTFTAPKDKAFDCWLVGNNTYAPGDKITVEADITVTAQWKDVPPVHVHTPELKEAKQATCTEEGNTAYYVCTGCGKWFEDKTALVEITDKSSVIINPTGHRWDNGVVTKEPTYTEEGIRTYTCLNDSSHTKEEAIPKKRRSSGGGSGSGSSGSVSGKRIAGGSWNQDSSGWHYTENGVLVKNAWKYLSYNGVSYWYYFDENGTMKTGWFEQNGNLYYLYPVSDGWMGRMVTGWQQIEGKWYFFETASGKDQGRMYRNERTPDGYYVGPDGAWDGDPADQSA